MSASKRANGAGPRPSTARPFASCKAGQPICPRVVPQQRANRMLALKDRVAALEFVRLREDREHVSDIRVDELRSADVVQDDKARLRDSAVGSEPEQKEISQPLPEFSGSLKGMLLLNLGAFLFGCNQVAIKTTEEIVDPLALDALRFGIAAVCFSPWLVGALRNTKILRPALELGLLLTAGYTAQAYGLEQTSAAHGSFTGTFTVLSVPVLVGLSGRRVAGRTWAAAAAGLLGVGLLTTSGGAPNWGDFWCIVSAIIFGMHTWRSETITTRHATSTTHLVSAQLFVLAATTCLMALPEFCETFAAIGPARMVDAAAELPWAAIVFMGAGTTAVTLWTEMTALKEVSAPLAALIYTSEPLWGAAFAWVLLNERWGTQGWIGAAVILSASLFSQLAGDPAEHVHAAADPEGALDGKKSN